MKACALKCSIALLFLPFVSLLYGQDWEEARAPTIASDIFIDSVWVANKVSFDIRTVGNQQFVAYYAKDRMMTVAQRSLDSNIWRKQKLPSKLMWDSHNSVALGIDEAGYIHVSGNMHTHPLEYFRSTRPLDIRTMVEVDRMTGEDEESVTYPKFFTGPDNSLLFSYRSGTCGNGNILVNHFAPHSSTWTRYLTKPLFEGIEKDDKRAAYHKFVRDNEGHYHFIWIWRWTPLVETSHQICYARTRDLIHWENAAGEELSLPFRPDDSRVIVDGTPSQGGMHNSRYQICLAQDQTPIIGYIKYDEEGNTQLYLSRFDDHQWVSRQISQWDFRWKFFGGGDQMSMGGNFSFKALTPGGHLHIAWETEVGEAGHYIIDPIELTPVHSPVTLIEQYPTEVHSRLTDHPEMTVNLLQSKHQTLQESPYLLKWESMGKSHGKHAPPTIPKGPLSPLKLIEISYN
ncbi:MAG: BNR repeat-containing protein [Saprospiraceae bacterium]|nr:BNR repeat-containing protein [Saprospiraceae bacterium]